MSKLKRVFTIIMCILLTIPTCLVSEPNNVYAETAMPNSNDYDTKSLKSGHGSGTLDSGYVDVSDCDYVILTLNAPTTSVHNVSMVYTSTKGTLQDTLGVNLSYFVKNGSLATGTNLATVDGAVNSSVNATYDVRNISKVRFYGSGTSGVGVNAQGASWTVESNYSITGLVPKKPVFSGDLASGNLTRPCAYIVFL